MRMSWQRPPPFRAHAVSVDSHAGKSWVLKLLARSNVRSSNWLPLIVGIIIALIGIGAVLGLLLWFNGVETRTFQRDFRTQCQLSVRSLETVLQVRLKQYVENVAAFTTSSSEVTNDTFIRFIKRSSFNPSITFSVAMMPVIAPSQVPLFESVYGKRFWNNDSSLVAHDQVALPLPIIFPEARFTLSIVGMNIMSDRYVLPFHAVNESPWTAECTPSRPYRARFRTTWSWVLFGVVLASFVLMAELARRGLKRVIVSQQTLHQLRVQERLLGTLQEYSKAITQAIPDAMVLLDSDGRIIGVNDATMEITSYCMAELNQMHVSALLVLSISIVEASEIVDQHQRNSARPWTVSPVVTVHGPAAAHEVMSRHTVADEFAQIILFHDISDQVEHVRVAAALGRCATEAAQARDRLLGFILGSVADLACDMVTDLSNADELLEERGRVGELADASEAARHMKAMLDDVAGLCFARIIDAALDQRRPMVQAKQLAILNDMQLDGLDAQQSVAAARFLDSDAGTGLRAVLAKTVAVGVGASLPLARWLVLMTVVPAEDPMGPPINQPTPATPWDSSLAPRHSRSLRSDSSTAPLEVSLSVMISRVAPGCITIRPPSGGGDASAATNAAGSEQYQDLDLSLGSRGARFGNVALTFAALTQMTARLGGSVEQRMPRVNSGDGTEFKLVVRVPIVVRVERQ
ncbi:hypothetical protein H9P43_003395 [Blastocladiella emersonii ATCC 22665]|nr:hypothetical protein H9P43_003395 [Blastocladiella emersonii ATCC 22665]